MENQILHTIDDKDLKTLVNTVRELYGYDFSNYTVASLKRRIVRLMINEGINEPDKLLELLKDNKNYLPTFINEVTVNITEMFRDPLFYHTLIDDIFPTFKELPVIRIWHAGCSSGEEVYSLAILLKEAGLLDKTLQYATDINMDVLQAAKEGKFLSEMIEDYEKNYLMAGGKQKLQDYYSLNGETIVFDKTLSRNMIFSHHNLVTDESFNEFNLILCRNVVIYFNRQLQDRVFTLFKDSLAENGFLALGTKESVEFSNQAENFISVNKNYKIWKIKKS